MYNDDEIWDNLMKSLFDDGEYLEEGLFDKFKEKRAEKKARKEEEERRRKQKEEEEKAARKEKYEQRKERMRRESLGKYVMFSASEEESGPKQDLADLANEIKSLIKHEIPGVRFLDNKARHNTTRLDEGCVLHKYSLSIFKMDDVNLKKFIKNSKNTNLKFQNAAKQTAGAVQQFGRVANIMTGKFDYKTTDNIKYSVDALTNNMGELINDDFIERITDPIIDKGFVGKRNALVKTKDGMDYLGVKIESGTFDYEITVSVKYIIKPEGYMESFEPVEELFGFGKKKNKSVEPKNDPNVLKSIMKTEPDKKYDGKKVKQDINKLMREIKKIMTSDPDIKPYFNNGLLLCGEREIYDLCGDDHTYFVGGVDEFQLIYLDLWDYKGGNPRVLMSESEDGWHPVDKAADKLKDKINEIIKDKFPDFTAGNFDGDWDTSSFMVMLKK